MVKEHTCHTFVKDAPALDEVRTELEETYSKHFTAHFNYRDRSPKPTVKNGNKNLKKMKASLITIKETDPAQEFSIKMEKLKEEGLDLKKLHPSMKSEGIESNTVRTGMIDISRKQSELRQTVEIQNANI